MNIEYITEQVRQLAESGKDYDDINMYLSKKGLSPEDKKKLLKLADQHILQYEFARQVRSKAVVRMILGGAILFIGLLITFGTMLMGNSQYILAYGAILVGAWILKEAYKAYKRPVEKFDARSLVRKRSKFDRF
ncbi:MAG: hypothetical protein MI974_22790 [Chitinophagales bacterium]|nr:hypothetical protein [Chitinophagales bacterium]